MAAIEQLKLYDLRSTIKDRDAQSVNCFATLSKHMGS